MSDELAARRRRFNALKAEFAALHRRREAADLGQQPAEPEPVTAATIMARLPVLIADLTEATLTAADKPDAIPIPGTPFTEGGVHRLLDELRERAATPRFSGHAIIANWLLKFVTKPPAPGEAVVAGANPEQLRKLAALLDRAHADKPGRPTPVRPVAGGPRSSAVAGERRNRLAEIEISLDGLRAAIEQLSAEMEARGSRR